MVRVCYQTSGRVCESSGSRRARFSVRSSGRELFLPTTVESSGGTRRPEPSVCTSVAAVSQQCRSSVAAAPTTVSHSSATTSPDMSTSTTLLSEDPRAGGSPEPPPREPSPLDERGIDAELSALPPPPRTERTLTVVLMAVTILASAALTLALRREVSYALSAKSPLDLGDLAQAAPPDGLENRYVRAEGLLSTAGAIRYERPMEGDSFRLAPLAGQRRVWVEIRVPEGLEGPKFTPPTIFAGRLVPFHSAGIRHLGLTASVESAGLGAVPEDALLLVDGASPRASRWSLALFALLAYFAAWNAVGLLRLTKRAGPWRATRRVA